MVWLITELGGKLDAFYRSIYILGMAFMLALLEMCQKGAIKMCRMVLKMCITHKHKCDRNLCDLWCAEYMLFCFQS